MTIRIFFLTIAFLSISGSYCQNGDLYIFKLKSGLAIKGELLRVIPDSVVVLRQYGMETSIPASDILEIIWSGHTNLYLSNETGARRDIPNLRDSGFAMGASIGGTVGNSEDNYITTSFTLQLSALYFVKPRWQAGLSLLLDPYDFYSTVMLTPAADVRYYPLRNARVSPVLYGQLGYGFNISSVALGKDGGIAAEIGLGIAKSTRYGNIFIISTGLKFAEFKRMRDTRWPSFEDRLVTYEISRIVLKFGWLF